jgi:leucyl/phenylalanyl-tRNA--protein transferase
MAIYLLEPNSDFPPEHKMEKDGPIAVSWALHYEQLKRAYSHGIFPWYNEGEPVQWWCPDPRFVLFPDKLKISHSMKSLFKKEKFVVTFNQAFKDVLRNCAEIPRKDQDGTWLSEELQHNLYRLHAEGWAHSCEVWEAGVLVGGLYGVIYQRVFYGESMFSRVPNASKFGFITWVNHLKANGITLIDCQYYSAHLESLGAEFMPRTTFLRWVNSGDSLGAESIGQQDA